MSKVYTGKYEPTLVYSSMLRALASVRRHGIEKYGSSEDWRDVPSEEFRDALMRHVIAFAVDGETIDKDSGLPHSHLAAANLMYLIERETGTEHGGITKFPRKTRKEGIFKTFIAP